MIHFRYSYTRLAYLLIYLVVLLYGLTIAQEQIMQGITLIAIAFILLNLWDNLSGPKPGGDSERANHNE